MRRILTIAMVAVAASHSAGAVVSQAAPHKNAPLDEPHNNVLLKIIATGTGLGFPASGVLQIENEFNQTEFITYDSWSEIDNNGTTSVDSTSSGAPRIGLRVSPSCSLGKSTATLGATGSFGMLTTSAIVLPPSGPKSLTNSPCSERRRRPSAAARGRFFATLAATIRRRIIPGVRPCTLRLTMAAAVARSPACTALSRTR